jgi:hypothetical protein
LYQQNVKGRFRRKIPASRPGIIISNKSISASSICRFLQNWKATIHLRIDASFERAGKLSKFPFPQWETGARINFEASRWRIASRDVGCGPGTVAWVGLERGRHAEIKKTVTSKPIF